MIDESDGGEPACRLPHVCSECGAMPDDDSPEDAPCWRCGATRGRSRTAQE